MKVVKCDFCGKEMIEDKEPVITVTVRSVETIYGNTGEVIKQYDACTKCGGKIIEMADNMDCQKLQRNKKISK